MYVGLDDYIYLYVRNKTICNKLLKDPLYRVNFVRLVAVVEGNKANGRVRKIVRIVFFLFLFHELDLCKLKFRDFIRVYSRRVLFLSLRFLLLFICYHLFAHFTVFLFHIRKAFIRYGNFVCINEKKNLKHTTLICIK